MKTIAIPIFKDHSSLLDFADKLILIRIENGTIIEKETLHLVPKDVFEKTDILTHMGIDTIIHGGAPEICEKKLKDNGIELILEPHKDSEEILSEYMVENVVCSN